MKLVHDPSLEKLLIGYLHLGGEFIAHMFTIPCVNKRNIEAATSAT